MGWLITRSLSGGFTRVFADGLGVPLMDAVLDLAKMGKPPKIVRGRKRVGSKADGEGVPRRRGAVMSEENKRRRMEMMRLRDEDGKTLQEIADLYTISRERVRQVIGNTGQVAAEMRFAKVEEIILGTLNKTSKEITMTYGISEGLISKHRGNKRHAIEPDSSVGLGAKWEDWVSQRLTDSGIQHEMMPSGHPFDILALGKVRIDVKARNVNLNSSPSQKARDTYSFTFRKKDYKDADFYVLVIYEYEVAFIIPVNESTASSFRIPWPPKSMETKYHKFLNRWDLIEKFALGEEIPSTLKRAKGEKRCGTYYSYSIGCRCEPCKAAASEYQKKKYPRLTTKRERAEHGTTTMYGKYKCRCELCVKAARDYHQARKSKIAS